MAIRSVHSSFSQLMQPLLLWLQSQSLQSAAAGQTPGHCWLAGSTVRRGCWQEEALMLRGWASCSPEKEGSVSVSSSLLSGRAGASTKWLSYPKSRIYCVIRVSVIETRTVAHLGCFD